MIRFPAAALCDLIIRVIGYAGAMPSTEGIVALIFYYVGFMAAGDFAAYLVGLFSEYEWGDQVSLIVFLTSTFCSCG